MNNLTGHDDIARSPEADRFLSAERRLFDEYDIAVQTRFISGDGGRIRVLETGSGEPLVMIHGGNSVAATWAPLWAKLGGRFSIFAPDRPGCGLSHRQDYRNVDFRTHAVRFVRSVMDGLGLQRASIAGNSMGGFWALLFALAEPERVDRVVLLGEPAGSTLWPGLRHRLGATPFLNRLLFATVARPRPDERIFAGLMSDPSRASDALVACAFAAAQLPGARTAWRTMLERVAFPLRPLQLTFSIRDELRALQVPVLFAWGDRDFCPVEAGRLIARHIPEAQFHVVPDAGHLVWLDQPEASADLVRQFLGSELPLPSRRRG